jgi:hypothetical protein
MSAVDLAQAPPVKALPYDPRCICNLMLDEANGVPITNLALQKLLDGLNFRNEQRPTADKV